jgi:hypothetical protein
LRKKEELMANQGCTACHPRTGRPGRPHAEGLFGRDHLSDGTTVTRRKLHPESLLEPNAKMVRVPPVMPTFRGH